MPTVGSKSEKKRKSKRVNKEKREQISNSVKAGTAFPVGRLARMLKQGRYCDRIGITAGAFMAGTLDFIAREIMDLSGIEAQEDKMKIIMPRHINRAVRADHMFNKMMATVTFTESSVLHHVENYLLPKKQQKELI